MAKEILSVSKLNKIIKGVIEESLPYSIYVQGEVAQVNLSSAGHCYFILKDEKSHINCVVWKSYYLNLKNFIREGKKITVRARVNFYEKAASFSLMVLKIEEKGEGELYEKYLKLKEKMFKEGLFDGDKKKPLPFLPLRAGLITSLEGRVIEDIKASIVKRFGGVTLFAVNTPVQGEKAKYEIKESIEFLNNYGKLDIIILARGGGSIQDLWPFNEEITVRAVAASKIPVITAIGHKPDETLCSLAADKDAFTPTDIGNVIFPDKEELSKMILLKRRVLTNGLKNILKNKKSEFNALFHRIHQKHPVNLLNAEKNKLINLKKLLKTAHPGKLTESYKEIVNTLNSNLVNLFRVKFQNTLRLVQTLKSAVNLNLIETKIKRAREKYNYSFLNLNKSALKRLDENKNKYRLLKSGISALNPQNVLKRGFTITKTEDGRVLNSAKLLKKGDKLKTVFKDGEALSSCISTRG